jgi:hypothetical protein
VQNSIAGSGHFSAKLHVAVMYESSPYIQDPTACGKVSTLPLKMGFHRILSPFCVAHCMLFLCRRLAAWKMISVFPFFWCHIFLGLQMFQDG